MSAPEPGGGDDAARWRRVRALFDAVVDLPTAAREAYLRGVREAPALLAQVRTMLRADAAPVAILDAAQSELAALLPPAPVTRALEPGTVVGPYVVGAALGRGATAVVHAARRADGAGDDVALKMLDVGAAEAVDGARFLREVRLASALAHPRIAPVLDAGRSAGRPWYVMPLFARGSLRERLGAAGRLALSEARQLAGDVAAALQCAHDAGVVHRDVKPANLLLDEDGRAVVADFGVARAFGDHEVGGAITAAGMTVGTPRYMSPEQLGGELTLDGRTDQYALACVVYEALVGEPAFPGDSPLTAITRRFAAPPPSARARRPDLPRAVDAALRRALAVRPDDRFATVTAFARALGA